MPRYRGVIKVRLREDTGTFSAFDKSQAEDYIWARIGEDGENLDLEFMDFSDLEVHVYEV